jgi:hypothetical protein
MAATVLRSPPENSVRRSWNETFQPAGLVTGEAAHRLSDALGSKTALAIFAAPWAEHPGPRRPKVLFPALSSSLNESQAKSKWHFNRTAGTRAEALAPTNAARRAGSGLRSYTAAAAGHSGAIKHKTHTLSKSSYAEVRNPSCWVLRQLARESPWDMMGLSGRAKQVHVVVNPCTCLVTIWPFLEKTQFALHKYAWNHMACSGCNGRIFLIISLGVVRRDTGSTLAPWCQ